MTERNLYQMPERAPLPGGVLDRRLGTSDKKMECATCKGRLTECAGHFGYVKLVLPVFHIGYFKHVVQILQCICKGCGRALLPEDDRRRFLRRCRRPGAEPVAKKALLKQVVERCKRVRTCPHCGDLNGTVKKAPASLKIVHDKYSKSPGALAQIRHEMATAVQHNEALQAQAGKVVETLNPVRTLGLFERMTQEDCLLLDLRARPEHLIMTHLPVPPVCIRPSVQVEGGSGSNEDDVTMKLIQIIEVNNVLQQGLDKGLAIVNLMENWDFLQVQCAMYINSELPGLPQAYQAGKPLRGFVQRLKGKQGRFRGNLSGKRVDFSSRTVISPDPYLDIDQVAVPEYVAMALTFPERVTAQNIEKLRRRVENGVGKHPGANFVLFKDAGPTSKVYLRYGNRRSVARDLQEGDVVERHLEDGDVVLFNRQPSLHKMSIMAHRVVVRPWRTFRFNECVCTPYNADFDGDEMNLHVPQTEEARAEAMVLMGVKANLRTPKSGDLVVAATQDFLTSAYLLTHKDSFFTRDAFAQICAHMFRGKPVTNMPPPTVLKPAELWTGKQVISVLVTALVLGPGDLRTKAVRKAAAGGGGGAAVAAATAAMLTGRGVSMEVAERTCTLPGGHPQVEMCPEDGYVVMQDGELLCGRLGKGTLGSGSKGGLFASLLHQGSADLAAECMGRLARLSAGWIGRRGFSIGIDDVSPERAVREAKSEAVERGYSACEQFVQSFESGTLQCQPGCDAPATLEAKMTGELSRIREAAGQACLTALSPKNAPLAMAQCGAKGSSLNISQMVACVGQQVVGGQRIPNGFEERALPHFQRGSRAPAAKGFVRASFFSGLNPTEFFFHTMAGREGLVDTAVKTAETGYMSRRLMKALEDLCCHYDGTVRAAGGGVVQLTYGDDGLDPVTMEGPKGTPLDLARFLKVTKGALAAGRARRPPSASGVKAEAGAGAGAEAMAEAEVAKAKGRGRASKRRGAPGAGADAPASPRGAIRLPADELCLLPREIRQRAKEACERAPFSPKLLGDLGEFLEGLAAGLEELRARLGLPADAHAPEERTLERLCAAESVTRIELEEFLVRVARKVRSKRMEPGSAVGATGAQSIGEPGTQMTLKTFHFAGVASMNVTLGVPRIKEIINASKVISTPIITVQLVHPDSLQSARIVKGRLERTALGEVSRSIRTVLGPGSPRVVVDLDLEAIADLQLEVTPRGVRRALLEAPKLKLKERHVDLRGGGQLVVWPPGEGTATGMQALGALHALQSLLPRVLVQGIPSVDRAVVNDVGGGRYNLLVEGTALRAVMTTDGVRGVETTSNHVIEVEQTLGIEAARSAIVREVEYTMGEHGMHIDTRHLALLADVMTCKGNVLGITRFGIAQMKESVLMLASFEKTTDHLFDAAVHSRSDEVDGVSECIIMGIPMPLGTGLFQLRYGGKAAAPAASSAADPPLLLYDSK